MLVFVQYFSFSIFHLVQMITCSKQPANDLTGCHTQDLENLNYCRTLACSG